MGPVAKLCVVACVPWFYTSYDMENKKVGFATARHVDLPDEAAESLLVALNGAGRIQKGGCGRGP